MVQEHAGFEEIRDDQYIPPNGNGRQKIISILSQSIFLKGFTPPEYLVEGVLQRGFIYSLTGRTGHAKTAIALVLARAVGCEDPTAKFGGQLCEKGRVLYLVGENADDIRARLIAANALRADNPERDRVYFLPGVFPIADLCARVALEADKLGGIDLILIDTSAAYFGGDDENNNAQAGAYARALRKLTEIRGRPCVIPLCHPAKYVKDPSELLPRGGGAYIAEVDGNLTAWRHSDNLVDLHHTDKFRGPGFEPITFKIEKITTTALVDAKGRMIPTVCAVAITEQEQAEESRRTRNDEDRALVALLNNPDRSHADLARACNFFFENGEPAKSRLQRTLKRLQQAKLIKPNRDQWALTEEGRAVAKKLHEDDEETVIDDRCGAHSNKPFKAKVGQRCGPTVPCAQCGELGEVFKILDGRLPKGKGHSEALHQDCAEDFFTGKPWAGSKPSNPPV